MLRARAISLCSLGAVAHAGLGWRPEVAKMFVMDWTWYLIPDGPTLGEHLAHCVEVTRAEYRLGVEPELCVWYRGSLATCALRPSGLIGAGHLVGRSVFRQLLQTFRSRRLDNRSALLRRARGPHPVVKDCTNWVRPRRGGRRVIEKILQELDGFVFGLLNPGQFQETQRS